MSRQEKKLYRRVDYTVEKLRKHGIRCFVANDREGIIHAYRKRDGRLVQFWAGNGHINGSDRKGIKFFIKFLEE